MAIEWIEHDDERLDRASRVLCRSRSRCLLSYEHIQHACYLHENNQWCVSYTAFGLCRVLGVVLEVSIEALSKGSEQPAR